MSQTRELTKQEKDNVFEVEFLPHIDSLYNFAYFLAQNEEDAKDLLQETYLKAYKYCSYYQKGTNAKAWLLRILKNTFINEYRKKAKKPQHVDFDETYQEENEEEATIDLRQELFNELLGDEITQAINSLDVDYRVIILLCDVEGFKYDEIAQIMDVPIGTVRSRLHRARKILKNKLKSYARNRGYGKGKGQKSNKSSNQ